MRKCRKQIRLAHLFSGKPDSLEGFLLLAVPLSILLVLWPAPAKAQSESAPPQSQAPSQTQSQKTAQATKAQNDSVNKQQSSSDASPKVAADKNKPRPKRVFTNDDLSGIGGGISVVGNSPSDRNSQNADSGAGSRGNGAANSGDKNEASWRAKAQAIRDQIAGVDQQIDKVKQEIAKSGPASFDPTTGLTQNVIVLHDRNAELQRLQDRKQNLEKQLEDLQDEGRKAGANPGWFR